MNILIYVMIDFLSTLAIFVFGIFLQSYVGGGLSNYILIAIVCFIVGLLFPHGIPHGVSISVEVILLLTVILYMIGRPTSTPVSAVLNQEIIGSLLPLIPTGLLAGFAGSRIKKNKK